MVPQAAAAAGAGAAARGLRAASSSATATPGDVEGYLPLALRPGRAAHLEAVVRELRARLRRGRPAPRLHPLSRRPTTTTRGRPSRASARAAAAGRILLGGAGARPAGLGATTAAACSTALTARLARAARAERPGLVVSAAVVPDEAPGRCTTVPGLAGAGWPGVLDAVCPMAYTPDAGIFRAQVEQARARVGPGGAGLGGIGAYRLALAGVVEKIRAAREAGASGVVLFSHESLRPPRPGRGCAPTPSRPGGRRRRRAGDAGAEARPA